MVSHIGYLHSQQSDTSPDSRSYQTLSEEGASLYHPSSTNVDDESFYRWAFASFFKNLAMKCLTALNHLH